MSKMTDSDAVEVLIGTARHSGSPLDEAILHIAARLREPAGVGGLVESWRSWAEIEGSNGNGFAAICIRECANKLQALAATPQAPAEAQACPCGLHTCGESWEPGCGLGNSEQHAEAQAQGGGEVCETCDGAGRVTTYVDPYDRGDVSSPEHSPCPACTAPPSAPVGVEDSAAVLDVFRRAGMDIVSGAAFSVRGQIAQLLNGVAALAQQPAAVDGVGHE